LECDITGTGNRSLGQIDLIVNTCIEVQSGPKKSDTSVLILR